MVACGMSPPTSKFPLSNAMYYGNWLQKDNFRIKVSVETEFSVMAWIEY